MMMEPKPPTRNAVFRILDANSNRAAEGLRTLEEYFRFMVEDAQLASDLKQLRHDLMGLVARFDRLELLSNRDVAGDIGRTIKTDSERTRSSMQAIVSAGAQRVQQALRCLEEYCKFVDATIASELEQIRYRAYELLAMVELRAARDVHWLQRSRLYVLIDCQLPISDFLRKAADLSDAGVDILQIRDKHVETRVILEFARRLFEQLDPVRTRIILNDRADLAAQAGSGVHLGQEDLPIQVARPLLPTHCAIGVSSHTIEQAIQAQRDGADYIGCGPTFPSKTKGFEHFAGLDFLRQVSSQISVPAFAIGGITIDRLDDVLATGMDRVAIGHAIWQAPDPAEIAGLFARRLKAETKDFDAQRCSRSDDASKINSTIGD